MHKTPPEFLAILDDGVGSVILHRSEENANAI